jgi:hypothetical protein
MWQGLFVSIDLVLKESTLLNRRMPANPIIRGCAMKSSPLQTISQVANENNWPTLNTGNKTLIHIDYLRIPYVVVCNHDDVRNQVVLECQIDITVPLLIDRKMVHQFLDSLWTGGLSGTYLFQEKSRNFSYLVTLDDVSDFEEEELEGVLHEIIIDATMSYPLLQMFVRGEKVGEDLIKLAYMEFNEPKRGWVWGNA